MLSNDINIILGLGDFFLMLVEFNWERSRKNLHSGAVTVISEAHVFWSTVSFKNLMRITNLCLHMHGPWLISNLTSCCAWPALPYKPSSELTI